MAVNELRIDGRIGKDAEVRVTNSGDVVLNFSIANTERKKQGNEWVDGDTSWYDVTYWIKPGEANNFKKGAYLCLRGRLKVDKWERDGVKHSRVKILMREVESWEFVKGGRTSTSGGQSQSCSAAGSKKDPEIFNPNDYENEVPW